MPEFVLTQINILYYYFLAGLSFSILFDVFTLTRKIFHDPKWLEIVEDSIFWILFIFVFFTMNYNLLYGKIELYSLLGLILGAAVYFSMTRLVFRKRKKKSGKKKKDTKC